MHYRLPIASMLDRQRGQTFRERLRRRRLAPIAIAPMALVGVVLVGAVAQL